MASTPKYFSKMFVALLIIVGLSNAASDSPCAEPSVGHVHEPLIIKDVDPSILEKRSIKYPGLNKSLVFVGPHNYVFPQIYKHCGPILYNFVPKPCDVFLVSYPNAGHRWVSQLLWLLKHKVNVEVAASTPLSARVPLLEMSVRGDKVDLQSVPPPRVISTHLPFSLIPHIDKHAKKIIYLARNPKDTIVANYRYLKKKFEGISLEEFFYWFQQNLCLYSPYWAHVREGIQHKGKSNVLVIYASDKPVAIIRKVMHFLDVTYSKEKLHQLCQFLRSIEQIDQKSWKDEFSPELNQKVNKWIKENGREIRFPFTPDLLA